MAELGLSAPAARRALSNLRDSAQAMPAPFAQPVMIVERTRIVGVKEYMGDDDAGSRVSEGMQLELRREASNRDDPFSVRVMGPEGLLLGYLSADIDEIIARLMDAGKRLYCKVVEVDGVYSWYKIWVEVYLDD